MKTLLAVDLGLRTGLAMYGEDGRLLWYRSRHFGSRPQLKRGIFGLLNEYPDIHHLYLEGGTTAELWIKEAEKRRIRAKCISAEVWRADLLHERERRSGATAKQTADNLARRVITHSDLQRPTSLRHDAAEAILVGLWGLRAVGWIDGFSRYFPERSR